MPSLLQTIALFASFSLCSARHTRWGAHSGHSSRTASHYSPTATLQAGDSDDSVTSSSDAEPTVASVTSIEVVPSATATASSTSTAVSNTTASSGGAPDGFVPGVKWQIAIQDPVDIRGGLEPLDAKVVDIDLFMASKDPTLIPALHDAGVIVLCYFNAGAVQYTDCDFPEWSDDGLYSGESVANYDQEKYVDITDSTVIDLHKARVDLAHSIGCDGLDPDNIDTYELDADESIGKQITQDDMISFLQTLADYAHSKTTPLGKPLMIGQKNAVEITESIHTFMDFAISENCVGSSNVGSNRGSEDEFCTNFQDLYVNNGKPVFDIEYPASLSSTGESSATSEDKKRRRRRALGLGLRTRRARAARARRDSLDIAAADVGCSAGADGTDMEFYCSVGEGNSTGISRILKLDNDEFGLNGCTQYCEQETSFLLPSYQSNETNSCCFGAECG